MAALQLAANIPRATLLAALVGGVSGLGGYVAAYLYQLPVGAAQTLVTAAFVGLAFGVRTVLAGIRGDPGAVLR